MRLIEKYRPKSFDEIVGQEEVIASIKNIVAKGFDDAPHMLFSGQAGTGKTSTAMLIAKSWFGKHWRSFFVELNASDERGIDVVREKIKRFAFSTGKRIIFLDEADSMTADAQNALRRIMERTTSTVFILSCNWDWKIIDPIKSRCAIFRFKKLTDKQILKRIIQIIKAEGLKLKATEETKKALLLLVKMADGDMRKAINMLDTLISSNREISIANVKMLDEPAIVETSFRKALDGDFDSARKLIEDALVRYNFDVNKIIDKLYKSIINDNSLSTEIKTRLIVRLSDLEYRLKFGASPVIQLISFISYVWIAKYLPAKCPFLGR